MTASAQTLRPLLEQLLDQFSQLAHSLSEERDALAARDAEALLAAAGVKHSRAVRIAQLEADLEAALAGTPLKQVLQTLADADPAGWQILEPLHTSLREVARQCRHHNAVNGKVVNRTRQSLAELARILSGTDADSIYTARGAKQAVGEGHRITHA
jgi:flagellar biosynthesis/type III secretory pathway chaperone